MDITIAITLKSRERWDEKRYGVILVDSSYHCLSVHGYLCLQDQDWVEYSELIKLKPDIINSEKDIRDLCEYTGKTRIYDMPKFMDMMKKLNIDVFVYQYQKECDC